MLCSLRPHLDINFGDVANIAARVQALAEPGAILVTAQVQRQVAGLFVAEERGTHALKGVPEPTRCSGSFARVEAAAVPGSAISPRLWAGMKKSPC